MGKTGKQMDFSGNHRRFVHAPSHPATNSTPSGQVGMNQKKAPPKRGFEMEPAVRVELTTNGLQIRCSATELRWLKRNGELCEY
jgi:hypothetical protein